MEVDPPHCFKIRRIDAADSNNAVYHVVAWDGATTIDYPCSVTLNNSTDRTNPTKSQETLNKLFKHWYKSWQITVLYWVSSNGELVMNFVRGR